VYPSVFNPNDFISSKIFVDFILGLGTLNDKKILDMGCGSGIVSVYCASLGAKCLAADINPEAVRSAKENSEINGFGNDISTVNSNLFENINDKFDVIFFNPPYYPKEPLNDFERAFKAGEQYKVIKDFAARSNEYLNKNGVIYLIISSDMDLNEIKRIFNANHFVFEVLKEFKKPFETFYIIKTFIEVIN
jgi:release factor glutamine methyltransferase